MWEPGSGGVAQALLEFWGPEVCRQDVGEGGALDKVRLQVRQKRKLTSKTAYFRAVFEVLESTTKSDLGGEGAAGQPS